jgi:hypothetical protein
MNGLLRRSWPSAEAAQVGYERLRAAALVGRPLLGPTAACFARCGLAGLIAQPAADEDGVFAAVVCGACRPAWTPYADPRLDALVAGYGLLLGVAEAATRRREEVR